MSRQKMTRDTIPEGFTLTLAAVDAIPVLLFGGSMILAGFLLKSILFLLGAGLCLFAGCAKLIWKVIVVLRQRNVWWLFLQMRILMPIGLVLMVAGAVTAGAALRSFLASAGRFPSAAFFAGGFVGMGLMAVFGFTLDSSDARSNWVEQITNAAAQLCFFVGLLLMT